MPPAVELAPLPVPVESAGWSWEQWQRFANVGVMRDYLQATEEAFLGVPAAVSWEQAEAFYDRVQAEAARDLAYRWAVETRRYWSGPSRFGRRTLRAFRVSAAAIGLAPKSAFTPEYRRRQRARVKRRRR